VIEPSASHAPTTGYLFTDIEDSTVHWERRPLQMQVALDRHHQLLGEVIASHGGEVIKDTGDGVFAIFERGNPLSASLDIQRALQSEEFGGLELRVRIGVHAGGEVPMSSNLSGTLTNRAARVMATAWGGQVVASDVAVSCYSRPSGARLENLGVHELKGIDEPIRIYGITHPDLELTEFPPLRSLSNERRVLPGGGTPFFGRAAELAELAGLLDEGPRVIASLVAPGGYGKTRLATRLAELSEGRYPFGPHVVSLESATGPAETASAIAMELGVGTFGPQSEAQHVLDFLRNKRGLLVLDNAETIAHDPSFIADVAAASPNLHLVVTSRMPLGLEGERVVRLEGLDIAAAASDVRRSGAFRLFAHHARVNSPDLVFDDSDVDHFCELHGLVAGSPLALELAARWCRVHPVGEIVARIRTNLDVLSHDDPSLPARHRGSRAVFDYSWAFMSDDDRAVLAKLGVFVGDFSFDAAAGIADLSLASLSSLEAQSLVVRTGERRFALHALVRQYAHDRLLAMPDTIDAIRTAHADHYLGLVPAEVEEVCGKQQRELAALVAREMGNVRVAWYECVTTGRWDLLASRAEPLGHLLRFRGRYAEAIAWFAHAAEASPAGEVRARMLAEISTLRIQCGDHDAARRDAIAALETPGAPTSVAAMAELVLGNRAHARGELESAERHYAASIELYSGIGHVVGEYFALVSASLVRLARDEIDEADRLVRKARRIAARLGFETGMEAVFLVDGDIARRRSDHSRALDSYSRALALHDGITDPQMRVAMLRRLGSLWATLGDLDAAVQLHREAHALASDIGDRRLEAESLVDVGTDLTQRGDIDGACDDLTRALELARELDMRPIVDRALLQLACGAERAGDDRLARRIVAALAVDATSPTELVALRTRLGGEGESIAEAEADLDDLIDDLVIARRYGVAT
jgi:predicted ATPase/class 3 adenylate cyclase